MVVKGGMTYVQDQTIQDQEKEGTVGLQQGYLPGIRQAV
jgi:hypothetical protein